MSLNKKSVDDINVAGKRVLVRCDFNVPLKDGVITDETRINAALPTIQKLLNDGGKVILCSHLGKVKEGPNEKESLAPVAKRLSEKLGKEVNFVADYNVTGEAATAAVAAMNEGDVVLLQNTRFRGKEETKNGEDFSKELADLCDVYVCDAFGSSHRAHASVAGVTDVVRAKGGECAVGYLMQKEIDFLGNAVENPVRPFVAILGGAKVADKLNVINNLIEKCDTLIIGGGMAFTFLKAKGYEIGNSLVDDEKLDYCREMLAKAESLGKKLLLPVDAAVAASSVKQVTDMKLLFKERVLSFLGSYDIYGEAGEVLYTVKGKIGPGNRFNVYNSIGNQVGEIKQVLFRFMPEYAIYVNGQHLGSVKKKFRLLKNDFDIGGIAEHGCNQTKAHYRRISRESPHHQQISWQGVQGGSLSGTCARPAQEPDRRGS